MFTYLVPIQSPCPMKSGPGRKSQPKPQQSQPQPQPPGLDKMMVKSDESLWTAGVKLGSAGIILDPYSFNFYQTKPHVLVWRFQSWLSPHDGSAGGWCPDGSCREPSWVVSIIDTDINLKTTSMEPLENAICPWNCSFWGSIFVFRRVSKWFGWREWFHDRGW